MKIVFMGTPAFAAHALKVLIESGIQVVCVVSQPDRPHGRGLRLTPPPAVEVATAHGIPVIQPEDPNQPSIVEGLKQYRPDLLVVVAYGHILKPPLLELAPQGSVNLHASLLPKYRGAAPIAWAIIRGEKITGVTTIYMNERMDAGDIILQEQVEVMPEETAGELELRLRDAGAHLLVVTVQQIEKGTASHTPQSDTEVTMAPKLKKSQCIVKWEDSAHSIACLIRGLSPYPGAHTTYRGNRLKLLRAVDLPAPDTPGAPGTIADAKDELMVWAQDGLVVMKELQPAGKKPISAREFIQGYRPKAGERLGEEQGG